jgi:cytochrome c oxidase cbb3-type subunit 3
MSADPNHDRLLDHDVDGIREYDNPMPRWWLGTFWLTIGFSVLYLLNIPGIGTGKGRIADYEAEMAKAAAVLAQNDPLAGVTAEQLLGVARDPQQLALGKTTFVAMCASCHLADGGGQIGPNLTDAYWLHGNRPLEIMKTVVEGIAVKGMPPWGKILKPAQLTAVTGYVLTLRGTTPKSAKAPQGVNPDSSAGPGGPPTGVK